jgi:hypothetical protein
VSAAGDEVRYQGANQVRGLAFAAEDVLWAATTGGAVRWDLAANYVSDVALGPDGSLWFATLGGVSHLAVEGWRVREKSWEADVYEVATAPDHALWLATSQGAVQLVPFP